MFSYYDQIKKYELKKNNEKTIISTFSEKILKETNLNDIFNVKQNEIDFFNEEKKKNVLL